MVTFKKFGRKYTLPEEDAPTAPTRAQRKRESKNARYFAGARARAAAPPQLPGVSAGYAWATEGRGPEPLRAAR